MLITCPNIGQQRLHFGIIQFLVKHLFSKHRREHSKVHGCIWSLAKLDAAHTLHCNEDEIVSSKANGELKQSRQQHHTTHTQNFFHIQLQPKIFVKDAESIGVVAGPPTPMTHITQKKRCGFLWNFRFFSRNIQGGFCQFFSLVAWELKSQPIFGHGTQSWRAGKPGLNSQSQPPTRGYGPTLEPDWVLPALHPGDTPKSMVASDPEPAESRAQQWPRPRHGEDLTNPHLVILMNENYSIYLGMLTP